MSQWVKKKRGWSNIWTHPKLKRSIVDTLGFGLFPRISYNGIIFESIEAAKAHAEIEIEDKND